VAAAANSRGPARVEPRPTQRTWHNSQVRITFHGVVEQFQCVVVARLSMIRLVLHPSP
jgi:hypothetical protein